jgi:hypothetical protein
VICPKNGTGARITIAVNNCVESGAPTYEAKRVYLHAEMGPAEDREATIKRLWLDCVEQRCECVRN